MKRLMIIFGMGYISLLILLSGCSAEAQPSEKTIVAQDTLLSIVKTTIAQKKAQNEKILKFQKRFLPNNFYLKINKYLPNIQKNSKKHKFDWRLIIAIILKESYFKENARSHVGAMGLMQIMPRTVREIKRETDFAYINIDPQENIAGGIYYLYKQMKHFPNATLENRTKMALACYNGGAARVFDARTIARFKKNDPETWEAVKECLPLLTDSAENQEIHLEVWPQGLPNFKYFFGYAETVDYVDDIFKKYGILCQMFDYNLTRLSLIEKNGSTKD